MCSDQHFDCLRSMMSSKTSFRRGLQSSQEGCMQTCCFCADNVLHQPCNLRWNLRRTLSLSLSLSFPHDSSVGQMLTGVAHIQAETLLTAQPRNCVNHICTGAWRPQGAALLDCLCLLSTPYLLLNTLTGARRGTYNAATLPNEQVFRRNRTPHQGSRALKAQPDEVFMMLPQEEQRHGAFWSCCRWPAGASTL